MKKYIVFLLTIALILGCDKYIDEIKPTADISSEKAFSSVNAVDAVFTGIYRRLRWYDPDVSPRHDSRGIGAILNTWNVKGNDIIRPQSHWYLFEYRYQDRVTANGRKVNLVWKLMYEIIGTCNTVIANITSSSFEEKLKTQYIAEAKAIRGFAYQHLLMDYAQAYLFDKTAQGIPIYTDESTGVTATQGKPRDAVEQGYAQVLEDLKFASANLTKTRTAKWALDKNVVNGLLARVYLHMGDYANAATTAKAARSEYTLNAAQYGNGFQNISDTEWMWGYPQSNNQTIYYASFASIWGDNRYPKVFANPNFVVTFSDTDVRKLFKVEPDNSIYKGLYTTSKFTAAKDFGEDVVLMRVAEMYLIEAEALARNNKDTEAANILFELQSNRDKTATKSGKTGNELINEIMLERRKELYGERGVDFIDARRLGEGLTRDSNHPSEYRFKLVPGDYRYLLKIPQDELDTNDKINADDQNK